MLNGFPPAEAKKRNRREVALIAPEGADILMYGEPLPLAGSPLCFCGRERERGWIHASKTQSAKGGAG